MDLRISMLLLPYFASHLYQSGTISPAVRHLIKSPSAFINAAISEYCTIDNYIFDVVK
jgi:hypothetical protein